MLGAPAVADLKERGDGGVVACRGTVVGLGGVLVRVVPTLAVLGGVVRSHDDSLPRNRMSYHLLRKRSAVTGYGAKSSTWSSVNAIVDLMRSGTS
jgi:hypothetical protein